MKVHEVFRSIQGEGVLTGTPMTFIRLYGCQLSCPWCDTPQDGYEEMTPFEIIQQVRDDWACLTGGEPTIHEELPILVNILREKLISVAIETSGLGPLPKGLNWICVSPKNPWPDPIVLQIAHEVKLLVGSGMYSARLKVRDRLQWQGSDTIVSVQPVWDGNYEENLKEAIEIARFYGVRLSVQVHKYLGIR